MKQTNSTSKAWVDILLLAGLVLSIASSRSAENSWGSFHCIVSMAWYVLMLIHIWQHWGLTKAVLKLNRGVLRRNKITLVTIIMFFLLTMTVILFVFGVSDQLVRIHHAVTHPLQLVIVIHAITKVKQFLRFFKFDKVSQKQ
ncbi:MAG: hypothetical protein FWG27_04975 [Treponema sp.]|nr:hypothetical protein [Treponema sp.]